MAACVRFHHRITCECEAKGDRAMARKACAGNAFRRVNQNMRYNRKGQSTLRIRKRDGRPANTMRGAESKAGDSAESNAPGNEAKPRAVSRTSHVRGGGLAPSNMGKA